MSKHQGTLFIISGPSGVGKTTLVMEFLQKYQTIYKISRVVTYTTRQPRPADVNGLDYHFVSHYEFERKVREGFFLEWSGEYGAYYGTAVNLLDELASGDSKILVIDRCGAAQIMRRYQHAVLIWIEVSDISILCDRLKKRNTEMFEQVQSRLLLAANEIEQERIAPMYHYRIKNDQLDEAVGNIFKLVALRCRPAKD